MPSPHSVRVVEIQNLLDSKGFHITPKYLGSIWSLILSMHTRTHWDVFSLMGTWAHVLATEMCLALVHLALSGWLLCYLSPCFGQNSHFTIPRTYWIWESLEAVHKWHIYSHLLFLERWARKEHPRNISASLSSFRRFVFSNLDYTSSLQLKLVYLVFIFQQNSVAYIIYFMIDLQWFSLYLMPGKIVFL